MKRKNKSDILAKSVNEYCIHLKNGFSQESFEKSSQEEIYASIEKSGLKEKYLKEIDNAKRCGRKKWEGMIMYRFNEDGYIQHSVWMFCMKNLFGWKDKPETVLKKNKTIKVKLGFGEEDSDEI